MASHSQGVRLTPFGTEPLRGLDSKAAPAKVHLKPNALKPNAKEGDQSGHPLQYRCGKHYGVTASLTAPPTFLAP